MATLGARRLTEMVKNTAVVVGIEAMRRWGLCDEWPAAVSGLASAVVLCRGDISWAPAPLGRWP